MRINRNSGSGFEGQGQDDASEQRRRTFRQRYSPGWEVEGEVRGNLDSGLVLVDVSGLELSARVPFEAKPGQRLLLRIEALEPEIILKFIRQLHASTATLQIQTYKILCGNYDTAWQTFLQTFLEKLTKESVLFTNEASPPLRLGVPLPWGVIQAGESEVNFLYDLFHSRFIPQIKNSSGKAWVDIEKIQKSHIALAQEEKTCINAWAHIPWSGGSGLEKELLLIKEEDQKLEKMFISGVWPHLGPVFISALCLDGEISCRINAQNAVPFEQAVQLLNLGGIGAVLRYVKQNFELPPWQETRVITCLDYRERPPDSVPAILLRMGANRRH